MQRTTIGGRVGRIKELRKVNDKVALDFSVAVYAGKGKPDIWYEVTVWGKRAEDCKNQLSPGCPVTADGFLTLDVYMNKDGQPAVQPKISASDIFFALPLRSREEEKGMAPTESQQGEVL